MNKHKYLYYFKEGEVRKKKTAEVKEPKDSKEHKEAKEDDKVSRELP